MTVGVEPRSDPLRERVRHVAAEDARAIHVSAGEIVIVARAEALRALLTRLRDDEALKLAELADLTAVERPGTADGIELVYQLASPATPGRRVRVRVPLGAEAVAESVTAIHPVAEWLEREVHDLFGIEFATHPDSRRIPRDSARAESPPGDGPGPEPDR